MQSQRDTFTEAEEEGAVPIILRSPESTPTSPGECPKCNTYGKIWAPGKSAEWCDCPRGQDARAREEAREAHREEDRQAEAEAKREEAAQVPDRFYEACLPDFDDKIRALIQQWDDTGGTLYIWGDVGTGKSHLAAAVMHARIAEGKWGRFIITTELLLRIQESFGEKHVRPCKDWLHSFRMFNQDENEDYDDAPHMWASALDAPCIVLDDIATEYATDWAKARLFLLVNHRYNAASRTIITTNLDPQVLSERIGDRTVSRLMHGATVIHLTGQDRRLGDAPGG